MHCGSLPAAPLALTILDIYNTRALVARALNATELEYRATASLREVQGSGRALATMMVGIGLVGSVLLLASSVNAAAPGNSFGIAHKATCECCSAAHHLSPWTPSSDLGPAPTEVHHRPLERLD